MRIACPSCAVTYEVPDTHVRPGRQVRCARCGHEWKPPEFEPPHATEPEPEPPLAEIDGDDAPVVIARPQLSAMDLLAAHRKRTEMSRGLRLAWIASAVLLVGLLAGGIVGRKALVAAWPPSGRLFQAVGLGVTPEPARVAPPPAAGPAPGAPAQAPTATAPAAPAAPAKAH